MLSCNERYGACYFFSNRGFDGMTLTHLLANAQGIQTTPFKLRAALVTIISAFNYPLPFKRQLR
jgi:hypothetical protein